MNATTYNPLTAALAELTSPRARRFYAHKAQADIQTTLDAALTIYCAAAAVAQFLLDFYAGYNAAALPVVVEVFGLTEDEWLLIGAPAPKLLLSAQTLPHPGRDAVEHRQLRQLCKAVLINAIEALPSVREQPLITPAPTLRQSSRRQAQGEAGAKVKRGRKPKAMNPATTPEKPRKNPTTARNTKGKAVAID